MLSCGVGDEKREGDLVLGCGVRDEKNPGEKGLVVGVWLRERRQGYSALRREDMVSPHKRMNRGKKVAQSGSHRLGVLPLGAYSAGRVNWDSQMTRLFLQLAIKEIEAEGRGTTQLSNNSMCNIAAELSARTGGVITLKECKNRYGVLKRDRQAWILLADSRRGATGLGWNPVTGTFTAPDHFWGVMANLSWGNYGSPDGIERGTFDFGSFTGLLETGVYPENYPIFNSGNGGNEVNELPNFNYPRAHQQLNEIYQNREGFENIPWVNSFAGPSDNGPRVLQFVEEYNPLPHLYANSDFRLSHNSTGHATEAQAGYDNWEWMNNNNGNAGSSTNAFADGADFLYSIPADEFYAEIEEDELWVDILTVALLHAIQILCMPQSLSFHTCPLSGKAYLHELMTSRDERFQRELCMPKDTFAKIFYELQGIYGWSSSWMKNDGVDCFESFAMFMHLLRGHSNRRTQERF
ncbi:hypothetical protein RHMOL_Rhmol04G0323200 [Rhododendron molle]|uniref:Uncharacterized protein n=1 Tax=Rhododendron molle TaxID=49168 RepID=A0ACC0P7V6_RHOML|nr:hypothetical protein RHMOL_Rhmol04G0323200 [Rhododendron molle]